MSDIAETLSVLANELGGQEQDVLLEAADEIERLRGALTPFAKLNVPHRPTGNAGFYSIYFKYILGARAALKEGEA